ncbi:putative ribonuclease H-like domain-containing protein [Tanacetum coccineum]
MTDAKEMWGCIKSDLVEMTNQGRCRSILKQQFEGFSVSNSEGFTKAMTVPSFLSPIRDSRSRLDSHSEDDEGLCLLVATAQNDKMLEIKAFTLGGFLRKLKHKLVAINKAQLWHMTGNKAYLAEFQDFNGGPVAFGGSKGYITGKEFKNKEVIELRGSKRIKRKYSNARTPQQNGVAERKNRTLMRLLRTMLTDSFLPKLLGLKSNDEKRVGPREEEQVFLDELERLKRQEKDANEAAGALRNEFAQATENLLIQAGAAKASISTASPHDGLSLSDPINPEQDDSEIPPLEAFFKNSTDVADFTNFRTIMNVSPIPTSRIHSINLSTQILGDLKSAVQTRSKVNKSSEAHAFVSYIQKHRGNNHKDFQHCLFACFLSQIEPKKISEALEDESWVDAMQEELLQFKIQKVTPKTSHLNAVKRIFRYLKGKPKLGLWYPRVSSFDLEAYSDSDYAGANLDRKSTTGGCQFLGKRLISWKCKKQTIVATSTTEAEYVATANCCGQVLWIQNQMLDYGFNFMNTKIYIDMGELTFFLGLQVKQKEDGIFISQDKYVAEILKKFDFVNPKTSHLSAVKRIFRYLKGKPKLGLWYPRVSSFDLEAYSDSDYARANLDRKSTIRGCQFLGRRVISWQCKKQTIVATSTTEAEYVAAANCCGQVLWIKSKLFHSKTKHIAIRHHFIRDAYEKKLIQVLKIHTDDNVADLLTKAFDVSRFQFLVVTIGMINP